MAQANRQVAHRCRPSSPIGGERVILERLRAPANGLQRPQEVQQVLLLPLVELVELVDDGIGL